MYERGRGVFWLRCLLADASSAWISSATAFHSCVWLAAPRAVAEPQGHDTAALATDPKPGSQMPPGACSQVTGRQGAGAGPHQCVGPHAAASVPGLVCPGSPTWICPGGRNGGVAPTPQETVSSFQQPLPSYKLSPHLWSWHWGGGKEVPRAPI